MDLKQLRYFLAIAEEGQITAAAEKLHMAQPPLSYQLKLLEEELQVKLVERGPRKATLTGAGELLRGKAEQILDFVDSAQKEVAGYGREPAGTLSIGAISSSGGVVPNRQMIEFARNHPNIRLDIHEGNTYEVIRMLENGLIELGVVRTPFQHRRLNYRYAQKEPMVALMPENNRCGKDERTVTLRELCGKPLVVYRRFEALIGEAFAKIGAEPLFRCKNDDARTTIQWSRAGLGIGIVPRSATLLAASGKTFYKVIQCEELETRLAIVWAKNRTLSAAGQKFADFFSRTDDAGEPLPPRGSAAPEIS